MQSNLGIRIFNPVFTGQLEKLERAAQAFFESPVNVTLPITLMDAYDSTFVHVSDEIKATIVNVAHKSNDKHIVVIHAVVTEESQKIKKVAVVNDSDPNAEEEILRNNDCLTIIADVANGDAVISLCTDGKDREVDLDDMVNILPRLDVPEGLPKSTGTPITWNNFNP